MKYAFSHKAVWWAIEEMARDNQMSVSAMAKAAGLDPTALNKSKRISPTGHPRWPNLGTIAQLLAVGGHSLSEFSGWIYNSPGGRGRP